MVRSVRIRRKHIDNTSGADINSTNGEDDLFDSISTINDSTSNNTLQSVSCSLVCGRQLLTPSAEDSITTNPQCHTETAVTNDCEFLPTGGATPTMSRVRTARASPDCFSTPPFLRRTPPSVYRSRARSRIWSPEPLTSRGLTQLNNNNNDDNIINNKNRCGSAVITPRSRTKPNRRKGRNNRQTPSADTDSVDCRSRRRNKPITDGETLELVLIDQQVDQSRLTSASSAVLESVSASASTIAGSFTPLSIGKHRSVRQSPLTSDTAHKQSKNSGCHDNFSPLATDTAHKQSRNSGCHDNFSPLKTGTAHKQSRNINCYDNFTPLITKTARKQSSNSGCHDYVDSISNNRCQLFKPSPLIRNGLYNEESTNRSCHSNTESSPLTKSDSNTDQTGNASCHSKRELNNRVVRVTVASDCDVIDDAIPCTQPVFGIVLDGVTAFVDVRSMGHNCSDPVKNHLRSMGADISERINKSTTHVVFKDGSRATYERARSRRLHLVSLGWVEACRQASEHLSEQLYPPVGVERLESPPINSLRKRRVNSRAKSTVKRPVKPTTTTLPALSKTTVKCGAGGGNGLGSVRQLLMSEARRFLSVSGDDEGTGVESCNQSPDSDSDGEQIGTPLATRLLKRLYPDDTTNRLRARAIANRVAASSPLSPSSFPRPPTGDDGDTAADTVDSDLPQMESCQSEDPCNGSPVLRSRSHMPKPARPPPKSKKKIFSEPRESLQQRRISALTGRFTNSPLITSSRSSTKSADSRSSRKSGDSRSSTKSADSRSSRKSGDSRSSTKSGNFRSTTKSGAPRSSTKSGDSQSNTKSGGSQSNSHEVAVTDAISTVAAVSPCRVSKRSRASESSVFCGKSRRSRPLSVTSVNTDVSSGAGAVTGARIRGPECIISSPPASTDSVRGKLTLSTAMVDFAFSQSVDSSCSSSSSPTSVTKPARNRSKTSSKHYRKRLKLYRDDDEPACSQRFDLCSSPRRPRSLANRNQQRQESSPTSTTSCAESAQKQKESTSMSVFSAASSVNADGSDMQDGCTQSQLKSTGSQRSGHKGQRRLFTVKDTTAEVIELDVSGPASSLDTGPSALVPLHPALRPLPPPLTAPYNFDCRSKHKRPVNGKKLKQLTLTKQKATETEPKGKARVKKTKKIAREPKEVVILQPTTCGLRLKPPRRSSLDFMTSRSTGFLTPPPTVVLTNQTDAQRDVIRPIIASLGGATVVDKVTTDTTHVICGLPRRTLSVLRAIAAGCWLLSPQWLYASLEAGQWLCEEPFELHSDWPTAQRRRVQRRPPSLQTTPTETVDSVSVLPVFAAVGAVFVSGLTRPPRRDLAALLRLGGATLASSARAASVAVGAPCRCACVVTEMWALDSIEKGRALPFADYHVS